MTALDHPHLTAAEQTIVSESVAGLGQRLLRQGIEPERWANIVLAVTVELAGQVLRLVSDTEPAPPP